MLKQELSLSLKVRIFSGLLFPDCLLDYTIHKIGTIPASDGEEKQSGKQKKINEIMCDKGYKGK